MASAKDQTEAAQVIQTLSEAMTEHDARPDTAEVSTTLIWGDRLDGMQVHFGPTAGLSAWSDDLLTARSVGCGCGLVPKAKPGGYGRVIVIVPRAKAALGMRLKMARALVSPDGELWVAGHQRDGVKSAAKAVEALCGVAHLLRLKRRCRVLMAPAHRSADGASPVDAEAIRAILDPSQWRQQDGLAGVPGHEATLPVVSYPGVFSQGRLDAGSKALLGYLAAEPPRFKKALDVGSGDGVLGTWLSLLRPHSRVQLLDVSATACLASQQTLAANGIDGERATVSHTTLDKLPAKGFDLIVSNPPRHEGRAHSHELTARMVEEMAERLKRGGALIMVTDRNKTVEAAVNEHFHRVVASKQHGSYRVWHVIR